MRTSYWYYFDEMTHDDVTGLAGKYQWREFPVVITRKYHPGKYSKF